MAEVDTTTARQKNIDRSRAWRQANPYASRERNKKLRSADPVGYFTNLIYLNARRRARVSSIAFEIDRNWISSKIQQMQCEATGMQFDFTDSHGGLNRVNPYAPSIDRFDSTQGYTKTNCRIVIWFYNQAKSDLEDSAFREIIKSVAQKL